MPPDDDNQRNLPTTNVDQVVREMTRQKAEEALVLLEVQGTEALRLQKQKEGISLAMLIEEKNKAEAVRANADVSRMRVVPELVPPVAISLYQYRFPYRYAYRYGYRGLHRGSRSHLEWLCRDSRPSTLAGVKRERRPAIRGASAKTPER